MPPTLLETILEPGGISILFQPVVELAAAGPRLHGVECLARGPRGTNMEDAEVLFEYVRRKRQETLLDRVCVSAALAAVGNLPGTFVVALNVHASTLGRDREFLAFVRETATAAGIPLSRLSIEVVEHSPAWDSPSFMQALEELRCEGVRIALDDIGLGQSNYRMILDCRPDYFKVDRYIVAGVHGDPYRRAILRSIAQLAGAFGANPVAEGVENQADLAAVAEAGITLLQGHYFARAGSAEELFAGGWLDAPAVPPAATGER